MVWTQGDIQQWTDKLREEKRSDQEYFDWDRDYLPKMMAIIVRAVELYCGYHMRNIQLIVLAIVLESHSREKGRLDNISTDEEKSLIVTILATAQALIRYSIKQLNKRWTNGLHQFLQLKHFEKLNEESLKAVCMSNMNFFKFYEHLNGMTETIGDQEEREVLNLEYGVDCFELPRFKKYRFQYEKSKECVCASKDDWCEQIIADINEKMDAKRLVSQEEKDEIEKKMKKESDNL
ncbi:unnamed protein product [Rotaria socialis]